MEKNGSLVLSSAELAEIRSGTIPDRIFCAWGLTLEQLSDMIRNNQYAVIDTVPSEEITKK